MRKPHPPHPVAIALSLLIALMTAHASAQGFKFSQPDNTAAQEEAAKQQRIHEQLSVPCKASFRDKKIMVVIGERQSNGFIAHRAAELRRAFPGDQPAPARAGLAHLHARRDPAQIAQAEIDAYFRNDPDAALSAAKRLGASFVLRGLITSQASRNLVMRVNQVSVNDGFHADGQQRSSRRRRRCEPVVCRLGRRARMALTLVNEQADEVVARLYARLLRQRGNPARQARRA